MYSLTREWCTGIEVCTQFSPFIELETFFPEQALQTYIEGCKLSLILPVLAVADATYWFKSMQLVKDKAARAVINIFLIFMLKTV